MKTLDKIYENCELTIPKEPILEIKCEEKDNSICEEIKLGNEKFYINWEKLSKIIEKNYEIESDETNQIQEYFSNEKLLDEEIIYSSRIEGIDLSKEQKKKDTTEENEIKLEYKDAFKEAFSYLLQQNEISHEVLENVKNIFSSSKFTNEEMTSNNSRYRNDAVNIYKSVNGIDKVIHKAVDYKLIPKYLDDVFNYLNSESAFNKNHPDISVSATAAITHCLFEYVHPYFDGNGRVGRMILSWFIRKSNHQENSYFLSEIIDNNKNKYYKSLEHSQKTKDLTYHAAFMHAAMDESIQIYAKIVSALAWTRLSETQTRFLKKLLINGMNTSKVCYPNIKNKFVVSKQSFFKMIDVLIEKGVVAEDKEPSKVRYFYFPEENF